MFPGLALARTIVQHDPEATVRFAGTTRGIETRAVPEAGFALDLLPILPLSRRLAAETLKAPFAAVNGTFAARRLLREHRFDVVCGMGGYVTLPVALAARMEGVPVVLHEQNAVPGIANRLAARVASRIAVGVDAAAAAFPPDRTTVVGNPVRPELARLDRAALHDEAVAAFGLDPGRRTLFVFGGSQGARRINQAVVEATAHWPDPAAVQVLHACGRRDEADVRAAWAGADPDGRGLLVRIVPFVDRMDLAYAAADLAMTRAGAITVAELTAAGMPAVMVPLPHATADHQAANARAVAAAGGAVVVDDAALDGRPWSPPCPLLADPPPRRHGRGHARPGPPGRRRELAALVVEASGRAPGAVPGRGGRGRRPGRPRGTGWFESAGTRPRPGRPAPGRPPHKRMRPTPGRPQAHPPASGGAAPPPGPRDPPAGELSPPRPGPRPAAAAPEASPTAMPGGPPARGTRRSPGPADHRGPPRGPRTPPTGPRPPPSTGPLRTRGRPKPGRRP